MLTKTQLAEIQERCSQATAGPWHGTVCDGRLINADIPALLEEIRDLQGLLLRARACLSYRDTLDDKRLLLLIEEMLR